MMEKGKTTDVHEWTGPTGVKFREVREPSGTFYRDSTPRAVIDALEVARMRGQRVRLFLGNRETGQDWCEENDVTGYIGRSTGPIRVALLLPKRTSRGGGAILVDSIVRLIVAGVEVYRHPEYNAPEFQVNALAEDEYGLRKHGYTCTVTGTGANFKTAKQAHHYADFMKGLRATR
jgi:hypothetical protein